MKTLFSKITAGVLVAVALVMAAIALMGGPELFTGLLQGLGTILSMIGAVAGFALLGNVVGPVTETTTPDEHKVRDVDKFLTVKQPDRVPLIKMLRRARRGPRAQNEKVEWEEDAEIPRSDKADGGEDAGSAGAAKDVKVANVSYWRVDDTIYLPHNATAPGAILHVVEIKSASDEISVVRVDGGTGTAWGTVPAIADEELLVRIGNTKKEFFAASDYRTTMPVQMFNYIEQFDATIGISRRRAATKNYTKEDWLRSIDRQKFDYESSIEYKLFFGKRELKTIAGDRKTFMGGVLSYNLPKGLTYNAGDFTESDLISWSRQIFTGNSGSRVRYLYADPILQEDLMGIHLDKVRRTQVESKTLRMEVEQFVTSFGTIRIIPEQVFAEAGKERFGVVLDHENIRIRHLLPPTVTKLDLKRTQGLDGMARQVDEGMTLEVRYLETHATIQGSAGS